MASRLSPDRQRVEETAALGRALIEGQPGAGLLIVDAGLRILEIDGDVHRGREDFIGRRVCDVVPAKAWSVLGPHYLRALGGEVQSIEYEAVGEATVHSVRMAPIRDGSVVIGVMVLTEDVTEKVGARKRLADGARLQRSVLDVLDEGVVVLDPDGQLVQANPSASEILGTDLETADPETWWLPFQASRASDGSTLDIGATVLRTGEGVRDIRVSASRLDGQAVQLTLNYQPLRDDAGEISGLVLSFRDVTARESEHRRLAESQTRLREAHHVARLASWDWRPDTNEVRVFEALAGDASQAGSRATLEDLLAGMPTEDRRKIHEALAAMVRGELDETVMRSTRQTPSGPICIETRSRAVRGRDNELISIHGTSQDVTEHERAKQETARSRDFLQATLDSLPAHVAVLDEEGAIVLVNRTWAGFSAAGEPGTVGIGDNYLTVCASVEEPWTTRAVAGIGEILSGGRTEFSMEYASVDGKVERWFALAAAGFDAGGARVVISLTDITDRHTAQAEVSMQAALLDEVDVAVVVTSLNGLVTHWNHGAELLYGWTADEAIGRDAVALTSSPEAGLDVYVTAVRRDGRGEGEFTVTRKDGSTFPAFMRGRVMETADGAAAGRITVAVDMSERVESERALLVARDYMRAVADGMGEGLFTLDTEGRLIYMNEAGEKLLGWSSDELCGRVMHEVTHFRRPDGSDLPIEDSPMFQVRRDRRAIRVEDDIFIQRNGRQLPVSYTASPFETDAGVAGCVVVFEDTSERKAREESLQREADKLAWIGRIQDALAEDRFLLYAQPIVDLGDGAVVQHELLLRLLEPTGEITAPGAYLHIAEQYGLIGDIDRWVVERGFEIAASGRPVQINLSAHSIGDQGVLDHIERCIRESGADPASIVFEITETAIVEDVEAARSFADRLHTLGCKIALDDFGTGYGGFTYLKQLPVDYLKIDIEFVRDLVTNPGSRHVVEAVVALARGFRLQTVAEGVEDAETFELLGEMGVDFAQGYHIARPAPLEHANDPVPGGAADER